MNLVSYLGVYPKLTFLHLSCVSAKWILILTSHIKVVSRKCPAEHGIHIYMVILFCNEVIWTRHPVTYHCAIHMNLSIGWPKFIFKKWAQLTYVSSETDFIFQKFLYASLNFKKTASYLVQVCCLNTSWPLTFKGNAKVCLTLFCLLESARSLLTWICYLQGNRVRLGNGFV